MNLELISVLTTKRDSCLRLAREFNQDGADEFAAGHELLEQASYRLAREFEGKANGYTNAIKLIIEYGVK